MFCYRWADFDEIDGPRTRSKKQKTTTKTMTQQVEELTGQDFVDLASRASEDAKTLPGLKNKKVLAPPLEYIDPAKRKFCFVHKRTVVKDVWNFFQVKFMTWSNSAMILNSFLGAKNDEFWIWQCDGIYMYAPPSPYGQDPYNFSMWVGDSKGPLMLQMDVPVYNAARGDIGSYNWNTIAPGDDEGDRLSTILQVNQRAGIPTPHLWFDSSDPVHVHLGCGEGEQFEFDWDKMMTDLRTSNAFTNQRVAGSSVAPVRLWPAGNNPGNLNAAQSLAPKAYYQSIKKPWNFFKTPERFFDTPRESDGFMLFDDQVGPWIATAYGSEAANFYNDPKTTGTRFDTIWTYYVCARLTKVSMNAVSKIITEMFWRQYARMGFHIPIPVQELERWSPTANMALAEILADKEFDVYKCMAIMGHGPQHECFGSGLIYADEKSRKNAQARIQFSSPEKESRMMMLMEALKAEKRPDWSKHQVPDPMTMKLKFLASRK